MTARPQVSDAIREAMEALSGPRALGQVYLSLRAALPVAEGMEALAESARQAEQFAERILGMKSLSDDVRRNARDVLGALRNDLSRLRQSQEWK